MRYSATEFGRNKPTNFRLGGTLTLQFLNLGALAMKRGTFVARHWLNRLGLLRVNYDVS